METEDIFINYNANIEKGDLINIMGDSNLKKGWFSSDHLNNSATN